MTSILPIPKALFVLAVLVVCGSRIPATQAQRAFDLPVHHAVAKNAQSTTTPPGTRRYPERSSKAQILQAYGKLPLHFEANQGQTAPDVKFVARGSGYNVLLTSDEAVLALHTSGAHTTPAMIGHGQAAQPKTPAVTVLRMQLLGASPAPHVLGLKRLPGKVNSFIGNDLKRWRTNIPTYAQVKYSAVYPGVDLVYYGNQRQLEYDFIVAPGADPAVITLDFQGADSLTIDAQGDLVLRTRVGELRQPKPRVYQESKGAQHLISGRYILKGAQQVGFQVAAYDADKPLIIDPVFFNSTYLGGGGGDVGFDIGVDADGNAYVTGVTTSFDDPKTPADESFPTTDGAFARQCGSDGLCDGFGSDVFVTKLNPQFNALVYSTYLGGDGRDTGLGIVTDVVGNAYVTGSTTSQNFPTVNFIQGACSPPPTRHNQPLGPECLDAFVAKLDPTGSALVYSTYLGGDGGDVATDIALDVLGFVYLTGFYDSNNFPGAERPQPPTTNAQRDELLLHGADAFVTKLSATGTPRFRGQVPFLLFTRRLGGRAFEPIIFGDGDDFGLAIAVAGGIEGEGNIYVGGSSASTNFPRTTPNSNSGEVEAFQRIFGGVFDGFVTVLTLAGDMVYSTFLGGSGFDAVRGIAVDGVFGDVFVTGSTTSLDFPGTATSPIQPNHGGGTTDAFVVRLNPNNPGTSGLIYSTYLGGDGQDIGFGIDVRSSGLAYVIGHTTSTDLHLQQPIQSALDGPSDAFVTQLNSTGTALLLSTYWGGSGADAERTLLFFDRTGHLLNPGGGSPLPGPIQASIGPGIAVASSGFVFITGSTTSLDFPGTATSPIQPNYGGGFTDAFVSRLCPPKNGFPVLRHINRISPCSPLPELDLSIILDQVVRVGDMTVTFLGMENPGPEPQGFRPLIFIGVDTTATIEGVQLEIVYDETILDLDKVGDLLGEKALRILQLHKTWEDVTTSLDTSDNTLSARVPGLSFFAVALECMQGDCDTDMRR